jgi:hypothetical protein
MFPTQFILLTLLLLYNATAITTYNFHYLFLDSTIIRVETYLSVKSVQRHQKNQQKILFWYNKFKPAGDFWNALKDQVELNDIAFLGIDLDNGNEDYLKLEILNRYGGFFLNQSMIMLENFNPLIIEEKEIVFEAGCSSVIGAKAKSPILSSLLKRLNNTGDVSASPITGELLGSGYSGVKILKGGEFCWPGSVKTYESLFSNRFFGAELGFNSQHMFLNLIPNHVFSNQIEFDTINQVNNPIFCHLRRYAQADYILETDPGCNNPSQEIEQVYSDGTGKLF